MVFKKTLVFLLSIFLLFSCKKVIDTVGASGVDKTTSQDLKEIDVNAFYKISVPKYMSEMKSLNDDASFEYANIFKETYAIVIDENKEEFINSFKENGIYIDSLSPLRNYSKYQTEYFKENLENAEITNLPSRIKNYDSEQYKVSGELEGTDISYLMGFVEGKENMYMMMCWTTKNRYKKYENTFHLIQNSIKLKN